MLRKKAISDFIAACQQQGFSNATIVDQLSAFTLEVAHENQIQEIKILEEGEVAHPL